MVRIFFLGVGLSIFLVGFGFCFFQDPDAQAQNNKTGHVEGILRFTGKVPAPRQILTNDATKLWDYTIKVDGKTKGVWQALAVLEDAPNQEKAKDKPSLLVDQKDMVFKPRVVAVQWGQEVIFENSDLCNHSVMTHSLVEEDQFNVFASPGQPVKHTFAKQKNPVRVGCSLHGWMRAWVFVVPHPWFNLTDSQGRFRISNVPPGKYNLVLRHPDSGLKESRPVVVQPGKTTSLTLECNQLPD